MYIFCKIFKIIYHTKTELKYNFKELYTRQKKNIFGDNIRDGRTIMCQM